MKTIAKKAVISEEVPMGLVDLHVPPGWRLHDWLAAEHERIVALYPKIKNEQQEVSFDLRDMLNIADRLAKEWEEKRQLVRVVIREQMEYAKTAVTPDSQPLAERRIFSVGEHPVREHTVDAIYRI